MSLRHSLNFTVFISFIALPMAIEAYGRNNYYHQQQMMRQQQMMQQQRQQQMMRQQQQQMRQQQQAMRQQQMRQQQLMRQRQQQMQQRQQQAARQRQQMAERQRRLQNQRQQKLQEQQRQRAQGQRLQQAKQQEALQQQQALRKQRQIKERQDRLHRLQQQRLRKQKADKKKSIDNDTIHMASLLSLQQMRRNKTQNLANTNSRTQTAKQLRHKRLQHQNKQRTTAKLDKQRKIVLARLKKIRELDKKHSTNIDSINNKDKKITPTQRHLLLPPPFRKDRRNHSGVASHGGILPVIKPGEKWLRGTKSSAGKVPAQIAKQLSGRNFNDFNHFRREFWMSVAKDPVLSKQFSTSNRQLMQNGKAPFAVKEEGIGKREKYEIDHMQPIAKGGNVYDMDNLIIRTPLNHIRGK